jgi:hypothetical protein
MTNFQGQHYHWHILHLGSTTTKLEFEKKIKT